MDTTPPLAPPPAPAEPTADSTGDHPAEPIAGAKVAHPGHLSPGWRMAFIAGWVGVLAGFGAVWYAGRIAGIAPWWLGPETNPRFVLITAIPFAAPFVALLAGANGYKSCCYIGLAAGLISASVSLGDLHFPGLAVVEAIIGLCGISISVACLGGRMRPA